MVMQASMLRDFEGKCVTVVDTPQKVFKLSQEYRKATYPCKYSMQLLVKSSASLAGYRWGQIALQAVLSHPARISLRST
jgi:hypothetical protein